MVTRLLSLFLIAAFGLAVAPPPAHAGGYTFTKLVDSAMGFDPFEFGCPAISDQGAVAIRATNTNGVTFIVVATGTTVRRIADNRGGLGFIGRNPSLNDVGQVSFAANLDSGGEAILRGGAGGLVLIAQTQTGPFNFFGFDTSVNDTGQVAFKAELDDFDEGLFSGSGGATTTHYLASTSQFTGDDSRPSINDLTNIAFEEGLDTGGSGIFVTAGGAGFITIADDRGPLSSTDNPALNVNGVVAFHAFLDAGGEAIVTGAGGPLAKVADTTGPFSSFGFDGPSIDDLGVVAFTASLDAGGEALFVKAPTTVPDRVIGTGDPLDGSTVIGVTACAEGVNQAGQLAFTAQLADGRTGIYRAEPPA